MIHIQKQSDNGTKAKMTCAKSKDSEAWQSQTFDLTSHLDSVRVWWDEPSDGSLENDKRKSETAGEIVGVLVSAKGALTSKQISDAMGVTQQSINRVMSRLEKEELVTRSQNGRGAWCFAVTEKGKTALQDKAGV